MNERWLEWEEKAGRTLHKKARRTYSQFLDYARSKGFPRRRIRHIYHIIVRYGAFLFALCVFVFVLAPQFRAWLIGENAVFASPANQGLWFAELLIIIFAGVVLHFALRERGPPMPSLALEGLWRNDAKDGSTIFGVRIKNDGDTAGDDCVATLELEGIERPDIKGRKKPPPFQYLNTGFTTDLCWDRTSEKKKTLRSDDKGDLIIVRWMPRKRGRIEHFAIAGDHGWRSTSIKLAKEPSHYFAKVKTVPHNGKACYVSLRLTHSRAVGPVMELVS